MNALVNIYNELQERLHEATNARDEWLNDMRKKTTGFYGYKNGKLTRE